VPAVIHLPYRLNAREESARVAAIVHLLLLPRLYEDRQSLVNFIIFRRQESCPKFQAPTSAIFYILCSGPISDA
jgi:hypothetical protein